MGLFDFIDRKREGTLEMDTEERDEYIAEVEGQQARGMRVKADVKVIKGEDE